jgi:predicted  nucleic acid-binding Zn-ribbon protein
MEVGMSDQFETLRKLQTVDAELYRVRRLQQQKPQELERSRQHLAEREALLKTAEERLKALQLQQKEKEVELQTREASVKKLQSQLFQLKTNKEYTTMQHEIDALKADNSLLEETILSVFDAIDQAAQERQTQQRQVAESKQQLAEETARVERELAVLAQQTAGLERQRKELAPAVPSTALATYERILPLREGVAMVPVLNQSCGGCHWRLPPQVVNEVYLKARLVTCEHCNRILYVDDAQPLPPAP